jgi:hypothetical protein
LPEWCDRGCLGVGRYLERELPRKRVAVLGEHRLAAEDASPPPAAVRASTVRRCGLHPPRSPAPCGTKPAPRCCARQTPPAPPPRAPPPPAFLALLDARPRPANCPTFPRTCASSSSPAAPPASACVAPRGLNLARRSSTTSPSQRPPLPALAALPTLPRHHTRPGGLPRGGAQVSVRSR